METDVRTDQPGPVGPGEEFPQQDPEAIERQEAQQEAMRKFRANGEGPVKGVTGRDLADATEYFMSEEAAPPSTREFELNVGMFDEDTGEIADRYVKWTVQSISRKRIREIRRNSRDNKRRGLGATGEMDDMNANLRIAAEGTLVPDLKAVAEAKGVHDPALVLDARLQHKPGLIDQIAGEVLTVSGYDDDDIRDVAAGKD